LFKEGSLWIPENMAEIFLEKWGRGFLGKSYADKWIY